jgi:von Willebrand factor type A domain
MILSYNNHSWYLFIGSDAVVHCCYGDPMFYKFINSSFLVPTVLLTLASCGNAKFSSGGSGRKTPTPTPVAPVAPPTIPTTPPPVGPICTDAQKAIGANIVFLVDNSNSNAKSDCPGAVTTPQNVSTCAGETNREKSLLAAFDLLADVSTKDTSPSAASNISIVEFPSTSGTSKVATNGWISSRPAADSRATIKAASAFTRNPVGATPYGAAISAASTLFASSANDARSRVAVLITDGEPTDRDPIAVASSAAELRKAGVEVITVYIANDQGRTQRQAEHETMLRDWDSRWLANSPSAHYYVDSANLIKNLDDYLSYIFGKNGKVSLGDAVTSAVVPSCVDAPGSVCQRWKVEIPDSAGLENVVKQIIRTRAIKCQ